MENSNHEELREWVGKQTTYLDPPAGWRPDPAAALRRFHARIEANGRAAAWRRWPPWAAAAALVAASVLLLPAGRVAARQFWQFLTVRQVAFIRVNAWPEGVPSPQIKVIGTPIPPIPARDIDEVRWRVHYDPRLPRPMVLSGSPRLSTTFPVAAGTVIQAADLALALRKAGVTDQSVPPQWNGAQLALHTSAIVNAEWPDVVLVQSLPLTLTAPAGFDFAAFSALVLRVVGVGPEEARRLAERMGTVPPWLAPIDRGMEETATIEEIALNSGPATWFQEMGNDWGGEARLFDLERPRPGVPPQRKTESGTGDCDGQLGRPVEISPARISVNGRTNLQPFHPVRESTIRDRPNVHLAGFPCGSGGRAAWKALSEASMIEGKGSAFAARG